MLDEGGRETIIQPGTSKAFSLRAGDRVKIETVEGGQVADVTFKQFCQSLTRTENGRRKYGFPKQVVNVSEGDFLFDWEGEKIIEIIEDKSCAAHDILFEGCRKELWRGKKLGCRDLISKSLGIPRSDLPSMISLFMDTKNLEIIPSRSKAGDHVVMKILKNVKLGISACPDSTRCCPNPSEIKVEITRGACLNPLERLKTI